MNQIFSLAKLAYCWCPDEHKDYYHENLNCWLSVNIENCFHRLIGGRTGHTRIICTTAAEHGHLDCLQAAFRSQHPWDNETTLAAAMNGNIECLEWAHEHGCPWDISVTQSTAKNGHLLCLQYAHENKCPWDISVTQLFIENLHLAYLKYAHDNGCSMNINLLAPLARINGCLDCLQYAHKHNCS